MTFVTFLDDKRHDFKPSTVQAFASDSSY